MQKFNAPQYTLWEHVEALRQTLLQILFISIIGCLLCFAFYDKVLHVLLLPLQALEQKPTPVLLGPLEGFQTALKTSFWVGLTGTSPIWLFAVLRFIHPALKSEERQLIIPFLLTSALLISLGLLFALTVTIPLANGYLYHFNGSVGTNLWSLAHYMDYTLILLLANALTFEFSAILLFLIHLKWLSVRWLREKRRWMIVLIFVVSAVVTPPDVVTQILLAVPLIILYEGIVFYAYLTGR